MYAATFGCMSAPFGCMSVERLGAKYAVVGCKVCGRLAACMRLLGASLWIGWVHA